MANVNSPSSAIGIARGGKAPSRILPVEGDQLRAVGPQPRSESTEGATTSPGGDPPRRREQIRESGDVGGIAWLCVICDTVRENTSTDPLNRRVRGKK